jgi:CHRD domain/PEP-CTERM motif
MKSLLALIALCLAALPAAQAHTTLFSSPLGPEVPSATSFSGLSGNTTVAHIHCCVAVPGTGTVGVAVTPSTLPGFPTGIKAGSYSTVLDLTSNAVYTGAFLAGAGGTAAGAEAALVAGMTNGTAYFNVHSSTFAGGEIRGFLAPVPEPSSYALMSLGLLSLGALARRKRTG